MNFKDLSIEQPETDRRAWFVILSSDNSIPTMKIGRYIGKSEHNGAALINTRRGTTHQRKDDFILWCYISELYSANEKYQRELTAKS
jgi:hypothetical protein